MAKIVRRELSIDACAHIEMAVGMMLTHDEERYARGIRDGLPAENEEMRTLLTSIGGQHVLLEALRRAVGIEVLLRTDAE